MAISSSPPPKQIRLDQDSSPCSTLTIYEDNSVIFLSSTESESTSYGEEIFLSEDSNSSFMESDSGANSDAVTKLSSYPSSNSDAMTTREHELLKLAPLLVSTCCYRECLLNLTALDIMKFRSQFSQLNQTEQRQWLTERMYENSHQGISSRQPVTKFHISGMEVCKEAWCKVLDISEKRTTKIWQSLCKGQVSL